MTTNIFIIQINHNIVFIKTDVLNNDKSFQVIGISPVVFTGGTEWEIKSLWLIIVADVANLQDHSFINKVYSLQ